MHLAEPTHHTMTQYTLEMTDERARRFDRVAALLAKPGETDPPKSKLIDAALAHLLETHENVERYREALKQESTEVPPHAARRHFGTSIITLHYNTSVEAQRP